MSESAPFRATRATLEGNIYVLAGLLSVSAAGFTKQSSLLHVTLIRPTSIVIVARACL